MMRDYCCICDLEGDWSRSGGIQVQWKWVVVGRFWGEEEDLNRAQEDGHASEISIIDRRQVTAINPPPTIHSFEPSGTAWNFLSKPARALSWSWPGRTEHASTNIVPLLSFNTLFTLQFLNLERHHYQVSKLHPTGHKGAGIQPN
jgi:hypothetical protein